MVDCHEIEIIADIRVGIGHIHSWLFEVKESVKKQKIQIH
jgi:hypothetical protein